MTGRGVVAGNAQRLVRLRHVEALTRRAAAHHGAARRLLDERIAALQAGCASGDDEPVMPEAATSPAAGSAAQRETLAALLAHIARHAAAADELAGVAAPTAPVAGGAAGAPAPVELKAVRYFRSTWSRLSVEHSLSRSQALVPDNAGPLNTHRLLHQTLTTLRDASPAYVHRLIAHAEALLRLEQAAGDLLAPRREAARGARDGDPARAASRDKRAAGRRP